MDLQSYLETKFCDWQPSLPTVISRSKCSVTLNWEQTEFSFLDGDLIYKLERKEKIPPWVVAYSGGKSTKLIDYLQSASPHRFRLKVILKASAVPTLADKAMQYYGDESTAFKQLGKEIANTNTSENISDNAIGENCNAKLQIKDVDINVTQKYLNTKYELSYEVGDDEDIAQINMETKLIIQDESNVLKVKRKEVKKGWLESQWSEELWTNTESDGTSAICFCMAVKGGYLKQMQIMLDEKSNLIGMINATNGFTPLATAIIKGDINTVRFLLTAGAEVEQVSNNRQTPLHLAILTAHLHIADLLLDKGALMQSRDINGLRAEHYAADSGSAEMMRLVRKRGGDFTVTDDNGWTPLFRAVCQGASTELMEELVSCRSALDVHDAAGLHLSAAARLLTDSHGRSREDVLRLVDAQFPREHALANFTRLSNKIYRVNALFKIL